MGGRGRRRTNGGTTRATSLVLLFVAAFPLAVAGEPTDINQPSAVEEVLATVRDCMVCTPAPWPEAWQREYVDTVREAITSDQNDPQYTKRLQIVRDGFGPCWEGLPQSKDRSHFEVRRAQIRWYVENLMNAELPGEEERQTLRHQYEDLADHAARSLLAQFPFLDPNMVRRAKDNYLAECYPNIDSPLLPIFLSPFSPSQVDRIKERWHNLRYARVDLWRQLGGAQKTRAKSQNASSIESHPDYLLTQRSLSLLRPHMWALTVLTPEHYRKAVVNDIDVEGVFAQYERIFRRYINEPLWPTFKFPFTRNERSRLAAALKLRLMRLETALDPLSIKIKHGGPTAELKETTVRTISLAIQQLLPQAAFLRRPPCPGVSCQYRGGHGFSAAVRGSLYQEGSRVKERFKTMRYFHLGHRLQEVVEQEREFSTPPVATARPRDHE